MNLEQLKNKFYDIGPMAYKGKEVRIFRDKESFAYAFFYVNDGEYFPVSEKDNQDLLNYFKFDGNVYNIASEVKEEKQVTLLFKKDGHFYSKKGFGQQVDLDFTFDRVKVTVPFVLTRSKDKNEIQTFVEDNLKVMAKYKQSKETKINALKNLANILVCYMESEDASFFSNEHRCLVIDITNKPKVAPDKEHICVRGSARHECFHAMTQNNEKRMCGIQDLENNIYFAMNEIITSMLAKSGYADFQRIIKLLTNDSIPQEFVDGYFQNDPSKVIDYISTNYNVSRNEVIHFLLTLDAYMFVFCNNQNQKYLDEYNVKTYSFVIKCLLNKGKIKITNENVEKIANIVGTTAKVKLDLSNGNEDIIPNFYRKNYKLQSFMAIALALADGECKISENEKRNIFEKLVFGKEGGLFEANMIPEIYNLVVKEQVGRDSFIYNYFDKNYLNENLSRLKKQFGQGAEIIIEEILELNFSFLPSKTKSAILSANAQAVANQNSFGSKIKNVFKCFGFKNNIEEK